jgi:hypothetical protein
MPRREYNDGWDAGYKADPAPPGARVWTGANADALNNGTWNEIKEIAELLINNFDHRFHSSSGITVPRGTYREHGEMIGDNFSDRRGYIQPSERYATLITMLERGRTDPEKLFRTLESVYNAAYEAANGDPSRGRALYDSLKRNKTLQGLVRYH